MSREEDEKETPGFYDAMSPTEQSAYDEQERLRERLDAAHAVGFRDMREKAQPLVDKAKALVDSVSHDNNGSIVAGRYMGGNGGLVSRETIAAADALRAELERWK